MSELTLSYFASFLDIRGKKLFMLEATPQGRVPPNRALLVLPPVGEEMNKVRASISRLIRRIARRGVRAVVVDYFGTGDSEGDFENVSVSEWLADSREVCAKLVSEGAITIDLLGVRFGGLLAASIAPEVQEAGMLCLWEPIVDGSSLERSLGRQLAVRRVTQSDLSNDEKKSAVILRQEVIEVSGYRYSRQFLDDCDKLRIGEPIRKSKVRTIWIDCSRNGPRPVSAKLVEQAATAGRDIELIACNCQPFWATAEIVLPNKLIELTANLWTTI